MRSAKATKFIMTACGQPIIDEYAQRCISNHEKYLKTAATMDERVNLANNDLSKRDGAIQILEELSASDDLNAHFILIDLKQNMSSFSALKISEETLQEYEKLAE